ncbi:MAG: MazG family protein [Planctomycetaceae bacterium]|nr:MazG family protein [Planctomycetaceae bacterium]
MSPAPTPGTPPDAIRTQQEFWRLVEVVARLRAPDGCPWDREQTLKTIEPFTLEETYEVFEAIDADDTPGISEELGDLLLQVVLYAQIAADEGRFDLIPVISGITDKLFRRHPHVFGTGQAHTADQVLRNWEHVKQLEKRRDSAIDGIPLALPALARAVRLQTKASKVGFEWPRREVLWAKLHEEIQELAVEFFPEGPPPTDRASVEATQFPQDAPQAPDAARLNRMEDELGDVLFVVANIARRWGISPEDALRRSNDKFARRFQAIERQVISAGGTMRETSLEEMEAIYDAVKRQEKAG